MHRLHGRDNVEKAQRGGVSIQINEKRIYNKKAVLFLGEKFVRITEDEEEQKLNTYYDWTSISSIRTYSKSN